MVNVAETFTARTYLCLLKDDINAMLVHWPQKNFQVKVEKYMKNCILFNIINGY